MTKNLFLSIRDSYTFAHNDTKAAYCGSLSLSKKPVFGSPFEETISVTQLQWVKGETLVV